MMNQSVVPSWVRAVAWLSLVTAPVFASLGLAYSKPEWVCAGVALVVYGLVVLRRSVRPIVDRSSPTDSA